MEKTFCSLVIDENHIFTMVKTTYIKIYEMYHFSDLENFIGLKL